ncbi:MAG: hypothetical protein JSW08_02695 [archaeon]|nr:MAG: hypothetical protein JSW08_02695 [archaeon]
MNKLKNKKVFLTLVLVLAMILVTSGIQAFGITSPYWETRPLEVVPGQEIDVALELQNMRGGSNITLRAVLVSGEEITELTDQNLDYFVPFGRKDILVNLHITIPEDAKYGTEYKVGVSFTTVLEEIRGVVQMGSSIEKYFPVVVTRPGGEEKGFPTWAIILIVVIVVVILLIIFLSKKKKPSNQQLPKKAKQK